MNKKTCRDPSYVEYSAGSLTIIYYFLCADPALEDETDDSDDYEDASDVLNTSSENNTLVSMHKLNT